MREHEDRSWRRRRPWPLLITLGAFLAGCGDDDGERAAKTAPAATATPTAVATPCPTALRLRIDGRAVDLDLGASGIAHDLPLPDGIVLTFDAACTPLPDGGCGTCAVTLAPAAHGSMRRRCRDDMRVPCDADRDCPAGRCVDFAGPPMPFTTGGAPSCAGNQLLSRGSGTFEPDTGTLVFPLELRWIFYQGIDLPTPCPVCTGAAIGASGTCVGGIHDGEPCTVDAVDPLLGRTSYDCPPNPGAELGPFDLPMQLTTGTSRLEPVHRCSLEPFGGCFCADQVLPNYCDDRLCELAADGGGTCTTGPVDGLCAGEPFRGCRDDADCLAGDRCGFALRRCSTTANEREGNVAPLVRTGAAHPTDPTLAAVFCVPVSAPVPNQGLGFPGPGAIRLRARVDVAP